MASDEEDDDVPPLLVAQEQGSTGNQPNTSDTRLPRTAPVPVTLITGALGAGKTTLIRHILHEPHGFKVAVILNEVGDEQGLEQSMVLPVTGSAAAPDRAPTWTELTNGCLCCSVKSEFLQALESLLQSSHAYDYVLIEATGLADPGPVAASLWTDPALESEVVLDAIVALADVRHLPRQLSGGSKEVARQLAYADIVLLNKVDLVADDPAALARAEALVRSINAGATLHHTTRSAIDLALLLGRGFYSGGGADVPAFAASEASCSDCHAHGHCDVHNLDVQTINVVVDGRVDEERLRRLVEGLLWDGAVPGDAASSRRATVFRIKGMLTLAGDATQPPSRCMLQGVYELYELYHGPPWQQGEDQRARLLIVGTGLQRDLLQRALEACVAT